MDDQKFGSKNIFENIIKIEISRIERNKSKLTIETKDMILTILFAFPRFNIKNMTHHHKCVPVNMFPIYSFIIIKYGFRHDLTLELIILTLQPFKMIFTHPIKL